MTDQMDSQAKIDRNAPCSCPRPDTLIHCPSKNLRSFVSAWTWTDCKNRRDFQVFQGRGRPWGREGVCIQKNSILRLSDVHGLARYTTSLDTPRWQRSTSRLFEKSIRGREPPWGSSNRPRVDHRPGTWCAVGRELAVTRGNPAETRCTGDGDHGTNFGRNADHLDAVTGPEATAAGAGGSRIGRHAREAAERDRAADVLAINALIRDPRTGQTEKLPVQPVNGDFLVRPDGTVVLGVWGTVKVSGLAPLTVPRRRSAAGSRLTRRSTARRPAPRTWS